MPKVSVIVPVYNTEKYLRECLDSLGNQTLQDIEIICVNDGSPDNSPEILQEYAAKDKRIKIINQTNQGVACSRNNAITLATGEYILSVDSDDYIRQDTLELLYKKAKENNLDMLSFGGTNFDNDNKEKISNPYYEFRYLQKDFNIDCFNYKDCTDFISKMAVSACLTMYKHAFIKSHNIEFPPHLCFEDNLFFCKALINASRCGILKDILYFRRVHSQSITQNWEKNHLDFVKIAELVLDYLQSINIDKKVYEQYRDAYSNTVVNNYNKYEEKCRCKYYKSIKSFCKKYNSDYINKINKPENIFSKIFSIKNRDTKKVLTVLGVKIKIKNKQLIERQRINNIEISLKQQSECIKTLFAENAKLRNMVNEQKRNLLYKIYKYCPDDKREIALCDWYYEHTGETLNIENPQMFNEKIQWLKLNDSTPLKTRLADKYLVRDWVKEKIGEEYLIPLLGVWDDFDEINFDELPERFVLKCNHGCGYNIVVTDKSKLNIDDTRKKINKWLQEDFAFRCGFELHYSGIPRKILAEEYIENNQDDLFDYKFWCFNGEVKYIQFLSERNTDGLKMAFYDTDWNKQNFVYSYPLDTKTIEKPDNLNEMIHLAECLSKDFNHVRVDFYRLNDGKIYFGEMTFTSCSGMSKWKPDHMNMELGQMIQFENK